MKDGAMIETWAAMPAAVLVTFLLACWVLNLTPGSDVMFISASGAAGGPAAGLAAGLGVSAGSLFHVAIAALGVASLIAASELAFDVLRYGGAAYLLYLAWRLWRAPPPSAERGSRTMRRAFLRGALNNILNPKVSIFVLAFLPQFTDPARGPVWQQIVILGLVLGLASVPVNSGWGLLAGALGTPIRRFGRAMNRVAAVVFAGLAARLVWA
jgi:threonine/homoserine/homoserine lactone efflux protein